MGFRFERNISLRIALEHLDAVIVTWQHFRQFGGKLQYYVISNFKALEPLLNDLLEYSGKGSMSSNSTPRTTEKIVRKTFHKLKSHCFDFDVQMETKLL